MSEYVIDMFSRGNDEVYITTLKDETMKNSAHNLSFKTSSNLGIYFDYLSCNFDVSKKTIYCSAAQEPTTIDYGAKGKVTTPLEEFAKYIRCYLKPELKDAKKIIFIVPDNMSADEKQKYFDVLYAGFKAEENKIKIELVDMSIVLINAFIEHNTIKPDEPSDIILINELKDSIQFTYAQIDNSNKSIVKKQVHSMEKECIYDTVFDAFFQDLVKNETYPYAFCYCMRSDDAKLADLYLQVNSNKPIHIVDKDFSPNDIYKCIKNVYGECLVEALKKNNQAKLNFFPLVLNTINELATRKNLSRSLFHVDNNSYYAWKNYLPAEVTLHASTLKYCTNDVFYDNLDKIINDICDSANLSIETTRLYYACHFEINSFDTYCCEFLDDHFANKISLHLPHPPLKYSTSITLEISPDKNRIKYLDSIATETETKYEVQLNNGYYSNLFTDFANLIGDTAGKMDIEKDDVVEICMVKKIHNLIFNRREFSYFLFKEMACSEFMSSLDKLPMSEALNFISSSLPEQFKYLEGIAQKVLLAKQNKFNAEIAISKNLLSQKEEDDDGYQKILKCIKYFTEQIEQSKQTTTNDIIIAAKLEKFLDEFVNALNKKLGFCQRYFRLGIDDSFKFTKESIANDTKKVEKLICLYAYASSDYEVRKKDDEYTKAVETAFKKNDIKHMLDLIVHYEDIFCEKKLDALAGQIYTTNSEQINLMSKFDPLLTPKSDDPKSTLIKNKLKDNPNYVTIKIALNYLHYNCGLAIEDLDKMFKDDKNKLNDLALKIWLSIISEVGEAKQIQSFMTNYIKQQESKSDLTQNRVFDKRFMLYMRYYKLLDCIIAKFQSELNYENILRALNLLKQNDIDYLYKKFDVTNKTVKQEDSSCKNFIDTLAKEICSSIEEEDNLNFFMECFITRLECRNNNYDDAKKFIRSLDGKDSLQLQYFDLLCLIKNEFEGKLNYDNIKAALPKLGESIIKSLAKEFGVEIETKKSVQNRIETANDKYTQQSQQPSQSKKTDAPELI